jgi:hypothetical protein
MSDTRIEDHPLLTKLGIAGATNATSITGYVGPSGNPDTVRLYSSLENLLDSIEVLRKDILHSASTPDTVLPYGGTIIWLKKDSQVTFHRSEQTAAVSPDDNSLMINRGRLNIRVRGGFSSEVCQSRCKVCQSRCGVCHSGGTVQFANRLENSR